MKVQKDQQNEEGENEEAESIISHDTVFKNNDSSFNQLGIADMTNDHIYDPRKDKKDKQKATTSSSSNKWSTKPFPMYKPYSGTGLSSNPKSFVTVKLF
ncbi:hypothetical protein RhiirA1_478040 [Rhizophagus irregularis]|uniref:Uncharacterized protein n=1 Tax=Rhizophagus irregularis TaxID=588596 RepID=A0A2N0QSP3_9GLOM|nr:hypothetical protein RhiirA1_478040 [Rhizophagus irregularis]